MTYKLQPGTSGRIYYLLTVKDDGTMILYFHGTDRSLTYNNVRENENGWIVTDGTMLPPLASGRWQTTGTTQSVATETAQGTVPTVGTTEGLSPKETAAAKETAVPKAEVSTKPVQTTLPFDEPEQESFVSRHRNMLAAAATLVAFVVLFNIVGPFGLAALGFLSCGLLK